MAAPVKSFNLNIGPIHAHAFNADRTRIAITTGKEYVVIYALKSGKWIEEHVLTEHDMAVTSLDWAPKTNRIVTCSRDKNAYVWTFENDKWVACLVLARLSFAATCVKWSPLENKFAVGSSQKIVSICHYEESNNWWVAKHIKNPICSTVSCIDWHPGNILLAVGSYDFKARVFSAYIREVDEKPDPNPWGSKMPFGQLMAEFKSSGWVKSIGFSPNGCRLCWISQDATIYVVSADQDISKVLSYRGNEMPLRSLCWTSDNTFLTAGYTCMPYAYSVNSNQITRTAELDVPAEKNLPKMMNARTMFQNMDRLATQNSDSTKMNTLHQNCITQVLPFQGNPNQGVVSFSTVGFDSQLVIWPIKETIEYLWGTGDVQPEPRDDDLYCKCNEQDCDSEITHLLGKNWTGFCRVPAGGVCREVQSFNEAQELREHHLECLSEQVLVPPKRPFQCHVDEDHPVIRQRCCSDSDLCNDVIISDLAPMHAVPVSYMVIIVCVVATVFCTIGICIGIFWFSSSRSKRLFRRLISRIPYVNGLTGAAPPPRRTLDPDHPNEIIALVDHPNNRLFNDPEEIGESSGFGVTSLSQRTIALQIHLKKQIAKGRFGDVWVGDWKGEQVAVKIFNSRDESSWSRETKIYTANSLRHANILRFIGVDNKDVGAFTQLWMVTEYVEYGALYDYLEIKSLTKKQGIFMMKGISHGLAYLHTEIPGVQSQVYKPPIAHRDLKSRNILVKSDLSCVIADLGLAVRNIHGKMEDIDDKRVGTTRYLSPELLMDLPGKKFVNYIQGDVYATSLVFWEICRRIDYKDGTGSHPYNVPYFEYIDRDPTPNEMIPIVVEKNLRPTIDQNWYGDTMMAEIIRIMQECWTEKAASRLTALNIRNNIDRLIERERPN